MTCLYEGPYPLLLVPVAELESQPRRGPVLDDGVSPGCRGSNMSFANCLRCSLRVKSAWPVPIREDYDASHVIVWSKV